MQDPVLYEKGNAIQYTDSLELITKYLPLLNWQNNNDDKETALDIGCGSGSVTWEILRPLVPKYIRLVGADIQPKMAKFASEKYPELKVFILNVESKILPAHLQQKFSHVFSFYTLHWIKHTRQAMQNVYDMLKPGGQFFAYYLVSHVFCRPFHTLSTINKWKDYMPSDKIVTNYYEFDDENIIKTVRDTLEDIGYKITICKAEFKNAVAKNMEELKDFLKPLIVGYSQMPENLQEEVLNYTIDLIFEQKFWKQVNQNNCSQFLVPYRLMIILATKPS